MRVCTDIETSLYGVLTADGYSASAHALPSTLGATLPHIHVTRTGGSTTDLVVEAHNVDFDVYAADQADAMIEATNLCAWARDLTDNAQFYSSEVTTLPYNNPDPRHPTIGRATFKTLIYTRTKEVYNA